MERTQTANTPIVHQALKRVSISTQCALRRTKGAILHPKKLPWEFEPSASEDVECLNVGQLPATQTHAVSLLMTVGG
jgi:hypothetical protein